MRCFHRAQSLTYIGLLRGELLRILEKTYNNNVASSTPGDHNLFNNQSYDRLALKMPRICCEVFLINGWRTFYQMCHNNNLSNSPFPLLVTPIPKKRKLDASAYFGPGGGWQFEGDPLPSFTPPLHPL
jgi:hypothetical protein